MARVIQVIETEERRGNGTEDSPFRGVKQYWTFNGKLLAEFDPLPDDQASARAQAKQPYAPFCQDFEVNN